MFEILSEKEKKNAHTLKKKERKKLKHISLLTN